MELETPAKSVSEAAPPDLTSRTKSSSASRWTLALFAAFWIAFYLLNLGLPYLKNGSDIVFRAKVRLEEKGQIFPAAPGALRVMIFGDSKVLAGFLPSLFDQMAANNGLKVSSFNSGFPGTDVFLPEFEAICKHGQAPNVVFLTLPWKTDPPKLNLFHLIRDDHTVVHALFPFRFWLRDATDFMMNAASHGGVMHAYREARHNEQLVKIDRGYYLITEQSRFPGGRIPDNFHLASDQPHKVEPRIAPAQSSQIAELNHLIEQYHMRCYYLPQYMRIGENAPPPARDERFAAAVERATSCKVLGPDYFLYPNRLFSDQTHLNGDGARVYTAALFHLAENQLSQAQGEGLGHALQ